MYDHVVAALLVYGAPLVATVVVAVDVLRDVTAGRRGRPRPAAEYEQGPFTARTLRAAMTPPAETAGATYAGAGVEKPGAAEASPIRLRRARPDHAHHTPQEGMNRDH